MKQLPVQLEILNNFIWEKPQVVVDILKKNGISVSNKPTLNEIIEKSVFAVANDNQGFVVDVTNAIENDGESSFDPITLGVSAVLSIGSAIFGSKQAKKQREAMYNAKLMELSMNEKLSMAEINAIKEGKRLEIISNSILETNKALYGESTARQRDTALFIGIMAVGLAVMYATIQIFKK